MIANRVVESGVQPLFGEGSAGEEFLHQRVIAFGHQFHQSLVSLGGLAGQVRGNLADLGFAIAARLVGVSLHAHQVDHAGEALFAADGQLHRDHRAAKGGRQRFHAALEIGSFAVHARADQDPGQRILFREAPDFLRDHLHSADGIDHHQRRFHGRQHHLGFVREHVEAGSVDQVDLGLVPLDERHGSRDGHLPGNFFFVVVGDRGAFVHPAKTLGRARRVQHGRNKRGFAGVGVPHDSDVADVSAFVVFHNNS